MIGFPVPLGAVGNGLSNKKRRNFVKLLHMKGESVRSRPSERASYGSNPTPPLPAFFFGFFDLPLGKKGNCSQLAALCGESE